jgi:hypothetical protein
MAKGMEHKRFGKVTRTFCQQYEKNLLSELTVSVPGQGLYFRGRMKFAWPREAGDEGANWVDAALGQRSLGLHSRALCGWVGL